MNNVHVGIPSATTFPPPEGRAAGQPYHSKPLPKRQRVGRASFVPDTGNCDVLPNMGEQSSRRETSPWGRTNPRGPAWEQQPNLDQELLSRSGRTAGAPPIRHFVLYRDLWPPKPNPRGWGVVVSWCGHHRGSADGNWREARHGTRPTCLQPGGCRTIS